MQKYMRVASGIGMLLLGLLAWTAAPEAFAAAKKPSEGQVWVARPDGEKSCGMEAGQPLEAAAEELRRAGVTVLESRKGNDGKMHIQVCGALTGSLNAHLIAGKDLARARELGFSETQIFSKKEEK
ncbi:MAG: hypothetical protein NDJ89_12190 [Oligoflexia bacterium]|nr:hypothetical protein [Oligoflexia bacterium]